MKDQIVLTGFLLAAFSGSSSIAVANQLSAPPALVPGQNPPWIRELPAATAVEAAIHGANPHQTAVRTSAALEVLENFVYVLSGNSDPGPGRHGCPWPDGGKRAAEYEQTKYVVLKAMTDREPRVPGRSAQFDAEIERSHLAESKTFASEILSRFVSPASRSAYFAGAASWYERKDAINAAVAARRDPSRTADLDCANARVGEAYGDTEEAEQLRAKCEARKRAAAEREANQRVSQETEAIVERDRVSLARRGMNPSVLGFELGKPVALQPCQVVAAGPCALGASDPGINGFFDAFDGFRDTLLGQSGKGPGVATPMFVQLPASARPSWMGSGMVGATFALVLVADVAVGALIKGLDTAESETIAEAVTDKYPKAKHSIRSFTCSNMYGATSSFKRHTWTMEGLRVVYDPAGTGRCNAVSDDVNGTLKFETETLLKLEQQRHAKQKASDAKL